MKTFVLALIAYATLIAAAGAQAMPEGVWRSEGYGYLVEIREGGGRLYAEHRQGCVLIETLSAPDVRSFFGEVQEHARRHVTMRRGPTQVRFRALPRLPRGCARPLTTNDPRINFEIFADTFAAYYPFFEARGVNWRRAVGQARRRVNALPSDGDLYPILTDLIAPLDDGHISIEAGERLYHPDTLRAPGVTPDGQAWTWRSLRTSFRDYLVGDDTPLVAPAEGAGANRVLHGWLDGDIAYVAILAMGGFDGALNEDAPLADHVAATSSTMQDLLTRYAGARGFVIDLRVNSGGYDAVALEIASRFAAERTLAYRKQARGSSGLTPLYDVYVTPSSGARFTGPIAVLIGPDTVSGGETAALAFAALPNAQLIGAPTRGMFSDAIPKALPNGWTYTLSGEIARTPGGDILEGAGVTPDIATQVAPDASPTERFGADIARALSWLAR